MTAAERMRLMRARREANGLKPVVTWVPLDNRGAPASLDVRLLQARSLALHVVAAKKIEAEPELLDVALRSLTPFLNVLTLPERRRLYAGFRPLRKRVEPPPALRDLIPAALRAYTPR
jgi:hypothetical protein